MPGNLVNINNLIRNEADEILHEKGLLSILKRFGTPHITGSYALDLMTWRDLDIYIETEDISEEIFFRLGAEINSRFSPVKMSYRNERIKKTAGLPMGLYWGIYFGNERKGAWKIDIWAVDAQECRQRIQFCDAIAARLTPLAKQIILTIKSNCWQDPEYRRSYSSKEIYEAVLDKGITTIEDFRKYISSAGASVQ
jgi:hypothetical protein